MVSDQQFCDAVDELNYHSRHVLAGRLPAQLMRRWLQQPIRNDHQKPSAIFPVRMSNPSRGLHVLLPEKWITLGLGGAPISLLSLALQVANGLARKGTVDSVFHLDCIYQVRRSQPPEPNDLAFPPSRGTERPATA